MRRSLLVLGCVLLGCEPPPVAPDASTPDGGAPALELGSLDSSAQQFAPLPAEVVGVAGAQGGFHVPVTYRLPMGGVGRVTFNHVVRRSADGKLVSRGTRAFELGLFRVSQWTSSEPVTVFMCPTPVGVNIVGELLQFEVTAVDVNGGVVGFGAAESTFRCGPGATFCEDVCKG